MFEIVVIDSFSRFSNHSHHNRAEAQQGRQLCLPVERSTMTDFDSFTIEPADEGVEVYGHGTYPRGSVLEGQPRRTFIDRFDSPDDALKEHPNAGVRDYSTKVMSHGDSLADASGLPDVAPPWFDQEAAGERWDDDY